MGGKLKKLRKKKGKKFVPLSNAFYDDVFSYEDSLLEALKDPNMSPGNIERRFGRCVPRSASEPA